jgi:hypothetical protein
LTPEDKVSNAKTIWVFRDRHKHLELIEKLFSEFLYQIDTAGSTARKGQIVYAAIVPASKQRNSREENARAASQNPAC